MNDDALKKFVDKTAADLGEHFDAVQILASYTDSEGTHFIREGAGNWFARQGMAREFVETDQADTAARAIAEKLGDA